MEVSAVELRSGLRLLRDQWWLICLVAVLAVAASAFLTSRQTPQYASQITLFVSSWGSPDDTASTAYQGSLLSQQKVKSYAELLRGHHVMSGVIKKLGLQVTAGQLSGKVTASPIPDTALLTATVRDRSPQRAQQIAAATGEVFVALIPTLERASGGTRPAVKVTVVSPAELPTSPVSPQPVRNIGLAAVLGLMAGFGLAVARRALDTTVKTSEQAEEISGAPTLGAVPKDSAAVKRPLITPAAHGPRVEAFRKVRTNLQFVDVDRAHRAVVVTSAMPNEGKSVTACNLAVALAEAEKRVVVVDADLRRPSVARYLGLPNGVGLTSVLLGQASLEEATQSWGGRLFSVLTSGPIPPNPTTLLGSAHMRDMLRDLRTMYDTVIIDSPPALPIADAAVLAASCDGAIVVTRHGKTRHDQLRGTVSALRSADVPLLGTLLNVVPRVRGTYYEYRYAEPDQAYPDGAEAGLAVPVPAHR